MNQIECILTLIVTIFLLGLWIKYLLNRIKNLKFSKKSKEIKHGNKIEQFIPFMKSYPYDSNNFRSLGSPIDGVQFTEDYIILLEFKTENSQLTKTQKHIKGLVDNNKVRFETIRI